MSAFRERKDKINIDHEGPSVTVISEGDKLIKNLVNKQLDKNITLEKELTHVKEFETPTELINETEFLSGKYDLQDFKEQAQFLQTLQDLKFAELTDDEIELYLDYQKGNDYLINKHKNICSNILQQKLQPILNKLEAKQDSNIPERNNSSVSRHVQEIALNTKPDSLETKLYKFATSNSSKNNSTQINHPINSLSSLERDLFQHLDNPQVPSLKKRRKKAKKYLESEENDLKLNSNVVQNKLKTKWDVKDIPESQSEDKIVEKPMKVYSCSSQRQYTIVNNQIVQMYSPDNNGSTKQMNGKCFVAGKTVEDSETFHQLTEEEIRQIPKFHNYERGTPNNILFIKNLAKQTSETDLIALFSSFDTETTRITYRLLKGKMKGQAFVTMNSVEQATSALEAVNGSVLHNRPLVIQYGKST